MDITPQALRGAVNPATRTLVLTDHDVDRVAAELDRLTAALERLGSTNTMTAPLSLDPLRDAELIARMKFADAAARGDQ